MSDSPIITPEEFEQLLPLAVAWAEGEEARILKTGVALNATQLADARRVGVAHPERVRVMAVSAIPAPEHPLLQAAAEATGMLGPQTAGLSLRYGIYVQRAYSGDRFLVAHELVHTAQYERLGGFAAFLRQYLHECLTIGYPGAPLEQEAILVTERLRGAGA